MKTHDDGFLRLIALFKLLKAITLVAVGFGALHLLHYNDAADSIAHLLAKLGLNPDGHLVDEALAKIANVPAKDFKYVGIGSFVYAVLFLTEGTGLWLRKRWAEWFTVISTASLIPVELFEINHHPSIAKVIVLILNIAIAAYLVVKIRKDRSSLKEG